MPYKRERVRASDEIIAPSPDGHFLVCEMVYCPFFGAGWGFFATLFIAEVQGFLRCFHTLTTMEEEKRLNTYDRSNNGA